MKDSEKDNCIDAHKLVLKDYDLLYLGDESMPFTGKSISYTPKGRIWREANYKNCKLEGEYHRYYFFLVKA